MWTCYNDRYAPVQTDFTSLEEFEAAVRACFPDEVEDFALREGIFDGERVVYDERDEIALVWEP
jgi:hypothetical protein